MTQYDSQKNLPINYRLLPGEQVLAELNTDLDSNKHFADGMLIVTNRRLLFRMLDNSAWQNHDIHPQYFMVRHDHAGVGTVALHDANGEIACWHFTLGRQAQAQALVEHFTLARDALAQGDTVSEHDARRCPRCQAALPSQQEDCTACASAEERPPSAWTLLRLWQFARPYKRHLLLGLVLTLASTAATLVPPYLTMPLMDKVLIPYQSGTPMDTDLVTFYLSGLLGAAVLAWGLGWWRTYLLAIVSERIGADLRTHTYEHLMTLSLDYFGAKRTGDLMARISSETDRICTFLSLHLLDFVTDVLVILMTAAILFSIDPKLALVTLAPLPVIAWMIHLVRDRLRRGFEKVGRIWSEVTNVLADTIPGIRVVKAFAQEGRESARFREANRKNFHGNAQVNRVWALFSPTVTLLTEIGLLVVWAVGIWQVARGQITVGVLTAFLAYIGRFYVRLDSMSRIVSVTQKAAVGTKRLFDILDHRSSVPEPAQPVEPAKREGAIALRNVSFHYGSRAVIHDLNLDIRPGEMIGLVGHSGSGKSTLVNLICRFYDVNGGAICVDGVDIRSYALNSYRSRIGLVLQEPFLFYGSIAENIAYGKPDASREEIVEAARAAHAHDFIMRLPHGYDSLVGERGHLLSGGERQRISIARALLIDPQILILDEATASVDTNTEREIQKALDNLVRGRTTIAVAHRLSTLRKADRLVVMDRGRIVEMGKHDELLARQGHFYRLHRAQLEDASANGGRQEKEVML